MFGVDGHQGRAVAVDGNLLLVRERRPLAGQPAKISQVVLEGYSREASIR